MPAQPSPPSALGYLVPEFPGQTHSFFWREIEALRRRGVDVHVISTRRPPSRLVVHDWSVTAAQQATYLGDLTIRDVFGSSRVIGFRGLRALLEAARVESPAFAVTLAGYLPYAARLIRICRDRGVTHVHVGSCGRAALIAALASRLGGPSYSLTLHNPLSVFGPHQKFKWRGAKFATVITHLLLDSLATELDGHRPALIKVQSMGVDVEKFRRTSPYIPWRVGEPLRLFTCARLNPAKGHRVAVAAVAALRAEGVDARLTIAGEDDQGGGGFRRTLEADIAERGLGDAVRLLGAVNEARVIENLNAAHVFVLASDAEPLGVAYMEAMACETPVLGTRAGGVTELIEDGVSGLLVAPRSPDEVRSAVLRIAAEPELALRLGQEGRRVVIERFQADRGAALLIEMLASAKGAAV